MPMASQHQKPSTRDSQAVVLMVSDTFSTGTRKRPWPRSPRFLAITSSLPNSISSVCSQKVTQRERGISVDMKLQRASAFEEDSHASDRIAVQRLTRRGPVASRSSVVRIRLGWSSRAWNACGCGCTSATISTASPQSRHSSAWHAEDEFGCESVTRFSSDLLAVRSPPYVTSDQRRRRGRSGRTPGINWNSIADVRILS